MVLPLSVLDLSPVDADSGNAQALQNTLALARLADRLGYTRYWLAEHLNMGMLASSTLDIWPKPASAPEAVREKLLM
jgi:alkanesulfonate monooxygenase SsuD/methylene tetrahydromethanopterin reductase-like flavin-dependent oxidoreductase (luciferase family)